MPDEQQTDQHERFDRGQIQVLGGQRGEGVDSKDRAIRLPGEQRHPRQLDPVRRLENFVSRLTHIGLLRNIFHI